MVVNDPRQGGRFDFENAQASHGGEIGFKERAIGQRHQRKGISYLH